MTRGARAQGIAGARRRRHSGRRLAVLALAVAVPAMAHEGWLPLAQAAPVAPVKPMGFEVPGESFPGSAFYYLADEPYAPQQSYAAAPARPGAAAPAALALPGATARVLDPGPAARALSLAGTLTDRARAQYCLTMAIYYEAASEPDAGQRAVAQVVLNRVAHPAYPNTVCGVVFQGSERSTGCQFTFTCDGSLARKPAQMWWDRAARVARDALAGNVYQPAGLATHYHTLAVHPYWASSLDSVGVIGAHIFYRWRGKAGQKAAFSDRYYGGEPVAAPHPRLATPAPVAETDPLAIARAWESGLAAARSVAPAAASPQARNSPAPAYAPEIQARGGDALYQPQGVENIGQVREEYARSGQWLTQP